MKPYIMMILVITLVTAMCKPDSEVLLLDDTNDGQTFFMTKEDEVVISLNSNATTGYMWEIADINTQVISEKRKSDYLVQSQKLGAPGIQVFYFIATGAGYSDINFVYRRSWESDTPPLKKYSVKIQVK